MCVYRKLHESVLIYSYTYMHLVQRILHWKLHCIHACTCVCMHVLTAADIHKLYYQVGVEDKPTVFLFTDMQVVEETFLEDINNILSSGEVYKPDEFEEVKMLEYIPYGAIKFHGRRNYVNIMFVQLIYKIIH